MVYCTGVRLNSRTEPTRKCASLLVTGFSDSHHAMAFVPKVLFFARDTLELVKRVELPGAVSSYHLVNAFQEEGKEDTVTVLVCQLRGDREELEATFRDIMGRRRGALRIRFLGEIADGVWGSF